MVEGTSTVAAKNAPRVPQELAELAESDPELKKQVDKMFGLGSKPQAPRVHWHRIASHRSPFCPVSM